MGSCDAAGDVEAEAETAVGCVHLCEPFEDLLDAVRWYPASLIADDHGGACVGPADPYVDLGSWLGVLRSVGDEVGHDLAHPHLIDVGAVLGGNGQDDVVIDRDGLEVDYELPEELRDVAVA